MTTATLIPEDVHHILNRAPRDIVTMLKERSNFVLAGGFIRSVIAGERVSDIDILGPSKDALEVAATQLALERKGRLHKTDNAFTVLSPGRTPVQFIHRWLYAKPEDVIPDFDFTIAMAGIWATYVERPAITLAKGPTQELVWRSKCHELFYPDLASKRLRYMAPQRAEDAGGSLLRARKFLMRGYHIEAPSFARVIARATMGVRDNELTSTEEGYAKVLTGVLREVDPLRVIEGLDLVDEHQVHPTE